MELIINISEEAYKARLKDPVWFDSNMDNAIRNGKPLPKGHGRLIDAERYRNEMMDSREFDFFKTLDMQPTIVEADKGV